MIRLTRTVHHQIVTWRSASNYFHALASGTRVELANSEMSCVSGALVCAVMIRLGGCGDISAYERRMVSCGHTARGASAEQWPQWTLKAVGRKPQRDRAMRELTSVVLDARSRVAVQFCATAVHMRTHELFAQRLHTPGMSYSPPQARR